MENFIFLINLIGIYSRLISKNSADSKECIFKPDLLVNFFPVSLNKSCSNQSIEDFSVLKIGLFGNINNRIHYAKMMAVLKTAIDQINSSNLLLPYCVRLDYENTIESQNSLELIRRMTEAYSKGDVTAFLATEG